MGQVIYSDPLTPEDEINEFPDVKEEEVKPVETDETIE